MIRKLLYLSLMFLLTVIICSRYLRGSSQGKNQEQKSTQSIIRKDLLVQKKTSLDSPLRNIFSPKPPGAGASASRNVNQRGTTSVEEMRAREKEKLASLVPVINLQYVGFVGSLRKPIGMVVIGGEVLAVEESEMILNNIKILKITQDDIEFVGPNSKKRKVTLEEIQ